MGCLPGTCTYRSDRADLQGGRNLPSKPQRGGCLRGALEYLSGTTLLDKRADAGHACACPGIAHTMPVVYDSVVKSPGCLAVIRCLMLGGHTLSDVD